MFKLIVLTAISMNGQLVGNAKSDHKQSFENQAACEAFVASEPGQAQLKKLLAQIKQALPPGARLKSTSKCQPDDSI